MNRRKSIRIKCKDCSGNSCTEITNCEFTDCPLYPFRSGQGKQNAKDRSKAIREFCLWCCNNQLSEVSKCPAHNCTLWSYRKCKKEAAPEIQSLSLIGHIGGS